MNEAIKILLISLGAVFTFSALIFALLYEFGITGIRHHSQAKDGQIKVACVGDSITYGCMVPRQSKNNYPKVLGELLGDGYHVENFGVSGCTLTDDGDKPYFASKEYRRSIEYGADILIFMLGTNDSKPYNFTDMSDFMTRYGLMLSRYIKSDPNMKIYLCTPARAFFGKGKTEGKTMYDIQPLIVSKMAESIREYASENGYDLIDIYEVTREHPEWFALDLVHPDHKGARAIAEAAAAALG